MRQSLSDMVTRGLTGDPRYHSLVQVLTMAEHQHRSYQQYQNYLRSIQKPAAPAPVVTTESTNPARPYGIPNQPVVSEPSRPVSTPSVNEPEPKQEEAPPKEQIQPEPEKQPVNEEKSSLLSKNQMDQLKAQIQVYKSLSAHLPVDERHFAIAMGENNVENLPFFTFIRISHSVEKYATST